MVLHPSALSFFDPTLNCTGSKTLSIGMTPYVLAGRCRSGFAASTVARLVCDGALKQPLMRSPLTRLSQVIGDTYAAHDLSDTERVIIGRNGLLLVTDDLPKFEPVLMCHLSLMARNVFMTSLFQVPNPPLPPPFPLPSLHSLQIKWVLRPETTL
jgi:hypothetical protein